MGCVRLSVFFSNNNNNNHHMSLKVGVVISGQVKCMKTALVGALRREKIAETTIQNLKAEIDCMNCLVCLVLTKKSYLSGFHRFKPCNKFVIPDIYTQYFLVCYVSDDIFNIMISKC